MTCFNKKNYRFLFIFLFASMTFSSNAQDIRVFGIIPDEEINMNKAPINPDAPAVVLFDVGKVDFVEHENSFALKFSRHVRIKIFDKDAGDKHANIEIPLYQENKFTGEEIISIEARTYNYDSGKKETAVLLEKNVYTDKHSKNSKIIKFAFPEVRDNSIIEYRYETLSPFIFNYQDWYFQTDIPTLYSEFIAGMIPFYEYRSIRKGSHPYSIETIYYGSMKNFLGIEYEDKYYRYAMENVPAFIEDEYMTTKNDYINRLVFQLYKLTRSDGSNREIITSWKAMSKDLMSRKDFGKYAKASFTSYKVIKSLNLDELSTLEKIIKIDAFVKDYFTWDKNKALRASDRNHKSLYESGEGTSGEINLFLLSLYDAAGIDAKPVILSTRDNGKISKQYPFIDFFNYVIASPTDGINTYVSDGTAKFLPFNILPARCLNDYALIVDKKSDGSFLKLHDISNSYNHIMILMTYNPENENFEGKIHLTQNAYEAVENRSLYIKSGEKEFIKKFKEEMPDADVSNFEFQNAENYDKAFAFSYNYSFKPRKAGNLMYFNALAHYAMKENPFQQEERRYPIDFTYRKRLTITVSYLLPESYSFEDVPENVGISGGEGINAGYQYICAVNGQSLQIKSDVILNESIYESRAYNRIREIFDEIYKTQNALITVKDTGE